MNDVINYTHYVTKTDLLGPYMRGVLWVNGCDKHCHGCLAENMLKNPGKFISIYDLVDTFLGIPEIEGITISGGEPFLQAEALALFLNLIKEKKNLGVIVYSGYTYEQLTDMAASRKEIANLLEQIDLLIDGPYIKELDDNRPYIGSSNQRLYFLSNRYKEIGREYYQLGKRKTEIRYEQDSLILIGVPSEHGLKVWNQVVNEIKKG